MSVCGFVRLPVYKETLKTLNYKALRTRKRCSNSRNPPSWLGIRTNSYTYYPNAYSLLYFVLCALWLLLMSQDHIGRGRGSIQLSRPPAIPPRHGTSRALCNISIIPKQRMGRRYYLLRRRYFPSCRLVNKSATQLMR